MYAFALGSTFKGNNRHRVGPIPVHVIPPPPHGVHIVQTWTCDVPNCGKTGRYYGDASEDVYCTLCGMCTNHANACGNCERHIERGLREAAVREQHEKNATRREIKAEHECKARYPYEGETAKQERIYKQLCEIEAARRADRREAEELHEKAHREAERRREAEKARREAEKARPKVRRVRFDVEDSLEDSLDDKPSLMDRIRRVFSHDNRVHVEPVPQPLPQRQQGGFFDGPLAPFRHDATHAVYHAPFGSPVASAIPSAMPSEWSPATYPMPSVRLQSSYPVPHVGVMRFSPY